MSQNDTQRPVFTTFLCFLRHLIVIYCHNFITKNIESDTVEFKFLEVNNDDKEMLEKVYAFRYKIVKETYPEYLASSDCCNNIEYDKYDEFSTHFIAINSSNKIFATVRLIHNSPFGYPTENCMSFDNSSFERDKLGEMSRIFVDSKYRNIHNTKQIIHEVKKSMYIKMMTLNIQYTYGSLEASFLRLLKMYKMCYEVIGKEQLHKHVGLRYPCILYTKRLAEDNQELLQLWKEKKNV